MVVFFLSNYIKIIKEEDNKIEKDKSESNGGRLFEGLDRWSLKGVKTLHGIRAACLLMEYNSFDNELIGVKVDLVPVCLVSQTMQALTENAFEFLPHNINDNAQKGELYQLMRKDLLGREECDTWLIENSIMENLPDNYTRSFRVAKYVLQNNVNFEILEDNTTELDDASNIQLYGLSPYISSYTFRFLFLHLLQ